MVGETKVTNKTLRNRRRRQRQREKVRELKAGILPVNRTVVEARLQPLKQKRIVRQAPYSPVELAGAVTDPGGEHIIEPKISNNLRVSDVDFINLHLDPCGEHSAAVTNGRVPDGSVPQSAALEYRENIIVTRPGQDSSTLDLTGKIWHLTVHSWPLYKTPYVFIANTAGVEPTRQQILDAYSAINRATTLDAVLYPTWLNYTTAGATSFYVSVKQWTATKSLDFTDDSVNWFKQFRITAHGTSFYDNTPDLINQGIIVGAQYASDYRIVSDETNLVEETVQLAFGPVDTNNVRSLVRTYKGVSTSVGTIDGNGSGSPSTLTFSITFTNDTIWNTGMATNTVPAGTQTNWTVTHQDHASGAGTFSVSVVASISGATVTVFSSLTPALLDTLVGVFDVTFQSVTGQVDADRLVITIPSSQMEELVQETSKTVTYAMKEDNGAYMVKRVWEPVFGWQEAKSATNVVFATGDSSTKNIDAPLIDVIDKNYGVGVMTFASVPYACNPLFKTYRVVEIVAGRESPYGPIMTQAPMRNPIVQDIIRDFTVLSPFMYGLSFNCLGRLFSIISDVIMALPKFMVSSPIIGDVVSGAMGALGTLVNAPGVSNRLVKTSYTGDGSSVVKSLVRRVYA